MSGLRGHAWTLWPFLRDVLRPPPAPPGVPFAATVIDPSVGELWLRGTLRDPGADDVVVLVHGLGGCAESGYVRRAARIADELGVATLRVSLRGADRSGDDFYHAGLTGDLEAILASPALERFSRRFALGFSLGGHVALRLGALGSEHLDGVVSVCAPLDLEASCRFIDSRRASPYRHHILRGLREMLRAVAAHREIPVPLERLRAIRTMRRWDSEIVAPRFGFVSAEDYYAQMSVAPLLGAMKTPALVLAARGDPMVAAATLVPYLETAAASIEVRWLERGGHVGFPAVLAVERDAIRWLIAQR